jgi:hypothetical protein
MITNCHVCGEPLSHLEQMLAESGGGVQCRHCWRKVEGGRRRESAAASRRGSSGGRHAPRAAGSRSPGRRAA